MDTPLDLGTLRGPVLVFGGPYSNFQATKALKDRADQLGIEGCNCICTGDMVAYGANPEQTVNLIREWGVIVIKGNCEDALASRALACGCGFRENSTCATLSKDWYAYADAHLSQKNKDWMGTLSPLIRFDYANHLIVGLHGGVDRLNQFVFASTDHGEKNRQAQSLNADVILAGHAGLPFTDRIDHSIIWHNAGAIGLPANDGTTDVWYTLLNDTDDNITLTHHRLSYDHITTAKQMRDCGLGDDYARAIENGLWPSLDILPPQERAATGHKINFT